MSVSSSHRTRRRATPNASIGFNQREISLFLDNVIATAKVGNGRPESNPKLTHTGKSLLLTIPWSFLLVQLAWSALVTAVAYALGDRSHSTLSHEFWSSRLYISADVTYGFGWALFVLLGFFIAEASRRYFEAQRHLGTIGAHLRRTVRCLRQGYSRGAWHTGDHERIASYLISFPLVLKMALRGERDPSQLAHLLHPSDLREVLSDEQMHVHCLRVVRAYFSAAERFPPASTRHGHPVSSARTLPVFGVRFFCMEMLDEVERSAMALIRLKKFQPAPPYVNHLRIFMYIWLFFVPLSIISTSGWFTIIFSVFTTYCVCMLFTISIELNNPFGYDVHDIKLNALCATISKHILEEFLEVSLDIDSLIHAKPDVPKWLEPPAPGLSYTFHQLAANKQESTGPHTALGKVKHFLRPRPLRPVITFCLLLFTVWSSIVVFTTWNAARGKPRVDGTRWFSVYIPLTPNTSEFVSIGLFILLSFWLTEAYSRYWGGLQLWQADVRPCIEDVALQLSVLNRAGGWHKHDRERIFSYLAAVPYAAKMLLRESRDVNNLVPILPTKDIQAILAASNPLNYVFDVLYSYMHTANYAVNASRPSISEDNYYRAVRQATYALWTLEKATDQSICIKFFPICSAFTVHLVIYSTFWLALLPLILVLHDGFVSFIYLIPIAYSIINLIIIGVELTEPFGPDEHDIPLDLFSKEIRNGLHRLYEQTIDLDDVIQPKVQYDRESFAPKEAEQVREPLEEEASKIVDIGTGEEIEKDNSQQQGSDAIALNSTVDSPNETSGEPNDQENFEKDAVDDMDDLAKLSVSQRAMSVASTILSSTWRALKRMPHVSVIKMIVVTLWTVASVSVSFALSALWDDDRNANLKHGWSSPVEVDSSVISNVGFLLFLTLAFRTADGLARYDEAARLLFQFEAGVRGMAAEIVKSMTPGAFHEHDRERVVAHLLQLPLAFRDVLLRGSAASADGESYLCAADRVAFDSSKSPLDYLLNTVQAYGLGVSMTRPTAVRRVIKKAIAVKRFPLVGSYRNHQRVLLWVWLALLPLSMAGDTGFATILWVPIIAYGIFAMEDISVKLVDPLGDDLIDIPVRDLCAHVVDATIEVVNEVQWGCDYYTDVYSEQSTPIEWTLIPTKQPPGLEALSSDEGEDNLKEDEVEPRETAPTYTDTPSVTEHFLSSVPWWKIALVFVWTVMATAFSYGIRRRQFDGEVRWWIPYVSVTPKVALFISTGALSLLGFYAKVSFDRYYQAGIIWSERLRSSLHNLAVHFLSLFPPGSVHPGDHDRIIGHIVVIPLLLKGHLRSTFEPRELEPYLSSDDIRRVENAPSRFAYCVDVLRSYYYRHVFHANTLSSNAAAASASDAHNPSLKMQTTLLMPKDDFEALEAALYETLFLAKVPVSPAFVNLLDFLLGIWFAVLPFVFAEASGWFNIFWIPLISYGVFGIHAVASEIQFPFGSDLNDLKLDEMSARIINDVIEVRLRQSGGWRSLIRSSSTSPEMWEHQATTTESEGDSDEQPKVNDGNELRKQGVFVSFKRQFIESMQLAKIAVNWKVMLGYLVWATFCVSMAYMVHRLWPFTDIVEQNHPCDLWFCSRISVDSSIQNYIGFALFLLLGFRLVDSHNRYATGNTLWQENLIGTIFIATNRISESFRSGMFHAHDMERIMGFFAAYPVCLMGKLRGIVYKEKLLEVLGEHDVNCVISSQEPADYCRDVLYAYLVEAEHIMQQNPGACPVSCNEHRIILYGLQKMKEAGLACQELLHIRIPFGYAQHLLIFLFIYLAIIPFGLVESAGWVTIFYVMLIAYGTYGIEKWAEFLSDPFGHDVTDLPMEELTDAIIRVVKSNHSMFKDGLVEFIKHDRLLIKNKKKK